MNETELKNVIEATLLAAGRPITTAQLVEIFDERERPTPEAVQAALATLQAEYEHRGIELKEVASGWRIQIKERCAPTVSRLWQERPSKYSRALLETLALVAYRQPITRSEIEEIRGVAVSSTIMRTLHERNWIRVLGHREVPGRPEILGTTKEFLDYFGLKGLDQLPALAELRDVENVGVQLELGTGEAPMPAMPEEAGSSEAVATAESSSEDANANSEEDAEDQDDTVQAAAEDDSSTLVASSEHEHAAVREPEV